MLQQDHSLNTLASTCGDRRIARLEAEQKRNGEQRTVRYKGIPTEQLSTAYVVELLVRPWRSSTTAARSRA